jgi:hypothetical protein
MFDPPLKPGAIPKFSGFFPPDESDPDYPEWEAGFIRTVEWHAEQIKRGNVRTESIKPKNSAEKSPAYLNLLKRARETVQHLLIESNKPT